MISLGSQGYGFEINGYFTSLTKVTSPVVLCEVAVDIMTKRQMKILGGGQCSGKIEKETVFKTVVIYTRPPLQSKR